MKCSLQANFFFSWESEFYLQPYSPLPYDKVYTSLCSEPLQIKKLDAP